MSRGYGGRIGGPVFGGYAMVKDRLGPWRHQAACRDIDLDIFFPSPGTPNLEAKRICAQCEVRSECLEYALLRPDLCGVWGGASERERDRIRYERRHQ